MFLKCYSLPYIYDELHFNKAFHVNSVSFFFFSLFLLLIVFGKKEKRAILLSFLFLFFPHLTFIYQHHLRHHHDDDDDNQSSIVKHFSFSLYDIAHINWTDYCYLGDHLHFSSSSSSSSSSSPNTVAIKSNQLIHLLFLVKYFHFISFPKIFIILNQFNC